MRHPREIIEAISSNLRGNQLAENTSIAELLAARNRKKKRQQLKRKWRVQGLPTEHRIGVKRRIRAISRKDVRYNRKTKLNVEDHVLALRKIRPSALLDAIYPERNHRNGWSGLKSRDPDKNHDIELEKFSFLDNPKGVLDGLRCIAHAEAHAAEAHINFRDEYCLDPTPFLLLMEGWGQMFPVFTGGHMDVPMQKVLVALGIPQAMEIDVVGIQDFDDVWSFPICRRRGGVRPKRPDIEIQNRDEAITEFSETLSSWLGEVGVALTDEGRGWIGNILGESLENAERHSDGTRRDGTWSMTGFMVRRRDSVDGEWRFQVRLGIVNLGDTFSDSLHRALPEVRAKIDECVATMRKKGARQSNATLRTLVALQDGVTSVPEADVEDRGGYGLQEMLSLVSMLGYTQNPDHQPRVTIVSGASCIQLRTPYIEGRAMDGPDEARVLWCNPSNSRSEPPDDRYVYDLETPLPGTAISVGFILDHEYYRRLGSGGTNDGTDRPS